MAFARKKLIVSPPVSVFPAYFQPGARVLGVIRLARRDAASSRLTA